ncbi:hypothetical protein KAT24_00660 [Candidatus Pacearchaeota archaeon]|nr:hypothetical protein [Candidatus Pacearchaeota archaeon]
MIKVDIHNHLGRNGANPGFDETIDIVYNKLGSNSIFGIANSNDYRYEDFVEQLGGKYNRDYIGEDKRAIYVPEKDMLIVKCQEMFTKQGDVLAIAMPSGKNVETKNTRDSIMTAKDFGASLDAVHPFYIDGIGKFLSENPKLLEHFSSWEIYNGSAEFWFPKILPRNANDKALEFYAKEIQPNSNLDIGMSSSTDGHLTRTLGKCYTKLEDFNLTSPNLVNELDSKLRGVKSMEKLYMEPNKLDAFQHAFHMGLSKVGLSG